MLGLTVATPTVTWGDVEVMVQSPGRAMLVVSFQSIGLVGPLLWRVHRFCRLNVSSTLTDAGGLLKVRETFFMSALSQALTVGKFLWTLSLRSSSFTGGRGMASTCSSKLWALRWKQWILYW